MDSSANFIAKLEPFLLMSKGAKGAAAAKLIEDATSAHGVYVFGELLELPNIQELANSEQHASHYSLLQLFAYKTFPDYIQFKDSLPSLNDAQITKLKHLTLVSLAMEKRILPYQQLLEVLQISTIRELEDLIIDAIYMEVVRGKLNQKEQQFEVEYTIGRDVEAGKVETLLLALQNWASTTSAVLSTLDEKLVQLAEQTSTDKKKKDAYAASYQRTLHEVQEKLREPKIIPRAPNAPKSTMTEAGRAYKEAHERQLREKEEKEKAAKEAKDKEKEKDKENADAMDVDDEGSGTGNSRAQSGNGSGSDTPKTRKRTRS
jgi:COP9 signalosome complex subunit 7